ncbi:MAG TPA: hypothetical protein VJ302_36525 [Blastocatellia bacterium]|nr:hypothetical protein [Blastocatellia bacterium]
MARAMARHAEGSARVIPIILRKCDWSGAPFSKLQALPTNELPIEPQPIEPADNQPLASAPVSSPVIPPANSKPKPGSNR